MIEKSVRVGPHVVHVEERLHKVTRKPLPAKQTLCARHPANHIHEVYSCPHGSVVYCVGAIKPERSEIDGLFHRRFGCDCGVT